MIRFQQLLGLAAIVAIFGACKKDADPIIVVAPSSGAQVQLNGLAGSEAGSSAGNAVFLDLSADKQSSLLRAGWDLGFYSGSDFRVVINNTTGAGAKVLTKTDLNAVGAADTMGLTLSVNQANPASTDFVYFDDVAGDLSKTVIPAISATDASNPVIILNRGTGGSIPARSWIKLRVLRDGTTGYTIQYAGIQETTFKTLKIAKDALYDFKLVSIDNGIIDGLPEKAKWDITWSYSVYQTSFGAGMVPYNFSDLIAVNHLNGVTAAENVYVDANTATAAFDAFNKDSVAKTTMVAGRWTIGSSWRSTQPATGAKLDRFYIIKDGAGNYYKLRCLSMGVGSDGGTRGKPEFSYKLIAK